jgi:hypothetical protein
MLVQWLLVQYMMDLQGMYIRHVAAAFGLAMVSNSLAMVLGSAIADIKKVSELSSLLFVPQILFAGFFVRLSQIPVFLRWAQYLCGMSYGVKLQFLIEFSSTLKSCKEGQAKENCHSLLASNGLDNDQYWLNIILLFVLFVCARILAGFVLTEKARTYY